MSIHDDDRPGDDGVHQSTTTGRRKGRRTRIAVGAVSAAAVLGAGAYLVTTQAADRDSGTVVGDTGVSVPRAAADSVTGLAEPSASVSPPASPTGTSKAPATEKADPDVKVDPEAKVDPKVKKEVDKARAEAAEDGFPLKRPITAASGVAVASGPVNERSEKTAEGTVRIVSAKFDLTGQRELLLAADQGIAVGGARCTQRVRFSAQDEPEEKPSLLLCWRTSDSRSVVTMAVATEGKPSAGASVALLNKEWAKLR